MGDGNWNEDKGINSPKLAEGMTAVVYNKDKASEADGLPAYWDKAENEDEWYDYEEQPGTTENGGTSRWANAVTEDGSFWVWIPRYEYKIDYTGVEQGVNTDVTKAGKIYVNFIPTSTQLGTTGYTADTNNIVTSSDGYTIHPAFTNNIDQGGWDSEIARNVGSEI